MKRFWSLNLHAGFVLVASVFVVSMVFSSDLDAAETKPEITFEGDVVPILQTYCIGCHTADDPQGGLVMEDYVSLMRGGESGPAITAGVSGSSRLFLMASGRLEPVMPPDDAEGPSEEELERIAAWINAGAKGPDGKLGRMSYRFPKVQATPDLSKPVTALAVIRDSSVANEGEEVLASAQFGGILLENSKGDSVGAWDAIEAAEDGIGKINRIRVTPDGRGLLIASGVTGGNGTAAILDTAAGAITHRFEGHRDVLYAIAISPNGERVATGGYDRHIRIWDRDSQQETAVLKGHNGAIYDLDFSSDGKFLVSASADETAKIWDVEKASRLATLGQPEGEVFAARFINKGTRVVAVSGDNRLRAWRFDVENPDRLPALLATRFVDESPLTHLAISEDETFAVVGSAAGRLKLIRVTDWLPIAELDSVPDAISDLQLVNGEKQVAVAMMNGERILRDVPLSILKTESASDNVDATLRPVFLDLGEMKDLKDVTFEPDASALEIPRHAQVSSVISRDGEEHWYQFTAFAGEMWAIDCDASKAKTMDPKVAILDQDGQPVIRTRLQAVRDSYFTFRGKNSTQASDFRLFNWQEIGLNQYLYSNGEVTKTWMHPRGPDSGFNVYPGRGTRWTYFGTPHTTHALGEPAYVVRELKPGETPEPNGLPVFEIPFENDDAARGDAGNASRLLFKAPYDGTFQVRVSDNRGWGGADFRYNLKLRPAEPSINASISKINPDLRPGAGREFEVKVKRIDGFEGPVHFDITGLPEAVESNFPVTIESGQDHAVATIFLPEGVASLPKSMQPRVVATAEIAGRRVVREAGTLPELKVGAAAKAVAWIEPMDRQLDSPENWTLVIPRGETRSANLRLKRADGFDGEVRFGKETSGRNASFGVYVDNIGLSGLLVLPKTSVREFFITADPAAAPGKRKFFLTSEIDGKLSTYPITVEVR